MVASIDSKQIKRLFSEINVVLVAKLKMQDVKRSLLDYSVEYSSSLETVTITWCSFNVVVETTFLTVPVNQLCEQDPCKTAVCMYMPVTRCITSALCRPVYFDETGNVLNCTGKV